MTHKPEDVGITESEALEAARKMAYVLLAGPDAWSQIRPKLITADNIENFRKIAKLSPERMDKSFIEHSRLVAQQIVDHWATAFELWAITTGRDDLFTPLDQKLAEAEREVAGESGGSV